MYRWLHTLKRKNKGFTFVEVLVTVAIFSLVAVCIYATAASGIKVWQRAKDIDLWQRKALLNLEKISQELRCCLDFSNLNFPDIEIGFSGKEDQLSFPILVGDDIAEITYVFKPQDGSISREQSLFKDILDEKGGVSSKKRFLSSVKGLKFSYCFFDVEEEQYKWKDAWSNEEGIPLSIKIELELRDEVFTKTIAIPTT